MRNLFMLMLAITLIAIDANAQNDGLRLQAETRIDYSGEFLKSNDSNDKMGFSGRYGSPRPFRGTPLINAGGKVAFHP